LVSVVVSVRGDLVRHSRLEVRQIARAARVRPTARRTSYRDENGSKRAAPGEVLRIPAGHKHWSGGDAKEGATFYQHMNAKMDMIPAK
jgi:hypothetical protein